MASALLCCSHHHYLEEKIVDGFGYDGIRVPNEARRTKNLQTAILKGIHDGKSFASVDRAAILGLMKIVGQLEAEAARSK